MKKSDFKLDFVGIGASRCASTWISQCLKEHPQISISAVGGGGYQPFFELRGFRAKEKWRQEYLGETSAQSIKGEFHEHYFQEPREIAQRMWDHNSELKLLVSLRDPIERAYSAYLCFNSLRDKNWENFRDALDKEPKIINNGFYYKHFKEYFDIFPEENILVLLTEQIEEGPVAFIQGVYNFLGVDTDFEPKSAKIKVNSSLFKLSKVGRFIHKALISSLRQSGIGQRIRHSPFIRRRYYSFTDRYSHLLKGKKTSMPKETEGYLREVYGEDIEELENLINKDLNHWKK